MLLFREITSTRVSMTKKRTFLDISFGFLLGSLVALLVTLLKEMFTPIGDVLLRSPFAHWRRYAKRFQPSKQF